MQRNEIIDFLKNRVELFRGFDTARLEQLLDGSRATTFEQSEAVIEFGSRGHFLGVLLDGELSVSVVDDEGIRRELGRIEAGRIFGEMALMTGDRTMADVVCLVRCEVLLIPDAVFMATVMTTPDAVMQLSRLLTDRAKQVAYDQNRRGLADRAEVQDADPHGFALQSRRPHLLLVVNCGSSSLKYSLFDTDRPADRAEGIVERIGDDARHRTGGETVSVSCATHEEAFHLMVADLIAKKRIRSAADITAVGHRVVHGGEQFSAAAVIDDAVAGQIGELTALAPLHNPVNLKGIELARAAFPAAVHVAVFDTTFHHTLPPYAYLYGLPYRYYEKRGVRRYGFHGTSHAYVSLRAAQFLKRPYNSLEIVTCHLGSGASVCAVDHGRSVDTSMGFTPTAGLLMGTRSGDVDPGALAFIAQQDNLDGAALDSLVNRRSGLLGISGISNDMRELEAAAANGEHRALLAIKTFCYTLRKYIGAYVAAMQGIDAVVFTGGIGENSAGVRYLACQGLACMGIAIDEAKNKEACGRAEPVDISAADSRVKVLVVPTDESLMIARDTLQAVEREMARTDGMGQAKIPLEVSAHHVHLSAAHVALLFGEGHRLTPVSELSQPGQFACAEKVDLIGPKGTVKNVRVLGPDRAETQVEISMTEQFKLGIHPPIRESGDLAGTPGLRLAGPAGTVELDKGVICAMRHIHMSPHDALTMGLRDRYVVRVVVEGDRELVFGDVMVRVSPAYRLAMHIDTDEANAAGIGGDAVGHIESIQSRA